MAGKKRKAVDGMLDTRPARRQSGRVKKAEIKYEESDVERADSDDEFDVEIDEVSAGESAEEASTEEASASDDEYTSGLKKKGWTKTKGEDGRWQMVMDIPKAKDPGGVLYEDERIHPNTMEFLEDLKKNNQREWLKFHDTPYRSVMNGFFCVHEHLS